MPGLANFVIIVSRTITVKVYVEELGHVANKNNDRRRHLSSFSTVKFCETPVQRYIGL